MFYCLELSPTFEFASVAHPVPARAHDGVGALAQGHECVMYVCVMLALGSWKGGAGPPFRGGRVLCHEV